jgi:transcriptional regulator with XRE-family HTH domain
MDYALIGKKIKELRKIVGLTQSELAEEICTQALISRIEKGDIYPSATAIYQISKKLGVDVNYFFEIGTTPRLDYI